jgi:hypothetical protein
MVSMGLIPSVFCTAKCDRAVAVLPLLTLYAVCSNRRGDDRWRRGHDSDGLHLPQRKPEERYLFYSAPAWSGCVFAFIIALDGAARISGQVRVTGGGGGDFVRGGHGDTADRVMDSVFAVAPLL